MILHLVSDRRRLAPGAALDEAVRCLVTQAHAAAAAGIDVIQVREPDLDAGALVTLVSAVQAASRGLTRLVVNERLDVALACGADGVHLRGDSYDATEVRRCTPPGFLVGRSVHSTADALAAGPVDYMIAGTVWPSLSKSPGHPLLGLEGLAAICAAARAPVLAIGGIDVERAGDIATAGAAGVAGIGLFMAGEHLPCRAVPLETAAATLRRAFDSAQPRS